MVITNSAIKRTIKTNHFYTLQNVRVTFTHGLVGFILVTCLSHCSSKNQSEIDYSSLTDVEFDAFFTRTDPGFTGGDGTYSVSLPDGRNVWLFGDTFIGPVADDNTRKKTDPKYIRNCFVLQDGEGFQTLHQGAPSEFKSMIIPPEVVSGESTEEEIWYWPGDGFVSQDTLYVFASKFTQTGDGMWDFQFLETALVSYELPALKEVHHQPISGTQNLNIHFGHAIHEGDNYIYIYGLGKGGPCVARAKPSSIWNNWEFYDGGTWTDSIEMASPMLELDGSEQFTVFNLKNKFVYVTQLGSFSPDVYTFISDTPYGPWTNKKLIYRTPDIFESKDIFTYNTVAHPQFMRNSELLISYNTNSFVLEDHYRDASIYRPRFARIPIENLIRD